MIQFDISLQFFGCARAVSPRGLIDARPAAGERERALGFRCRESVWSGPLVRLAGRFLSRGGNQQEKTFVSGDRQS